MEHEGEEEGERLGLGMFLRAGYMLMEVGGEGRREQGARTPAQKGKIASLSLLQN